MVAPIRALVTAFCMVLFCAVTACPVAAQGGGSPQTASSSSSLKDWKASDEITFGGSVGEVVSQNPVGAPAGLNLLINGSQGVLYVNLGPNLGADVRRELSAGQGIQVVGIVETLNGQNYLLARELRIGDQKIEVRNQHGFLVHSLSGGPRSMRSQSGQIGGAR